MGPSPVGTRMFPMSHASEKGALIFIFINDFLLSCEIL